MKSKPITSTVLSAPQEQGQETRKASDFWPSLMLSVLSGLVLLGSLIYFAGPWNILANTRLLRLLIDAGVVKYHDRDAGFVQGVADHVYYMKAQEPVEWVVVLLAIAILFLFWVLRGVQFHDFARYHAIPGSFGRHARAYRAGLIYSKFLPLHLGETAATAVLQQEGATPRQAYSTLFLLRLFLLISMSIFALLGLLTIGWAAWLGQALCALFILGVAYWWTRPFFSPTTGVSPLAAAKAHLRELLQRPSRLLRFVLLSLLLFGMEDIVLYLLTMAFSTQQVLLHVGFDLILMAFVCGYLARQVPLTPGGIGQFEWGFVAALYLGGVGLPEAATVAILYSIVYYLAFGLFCLVTLAWRAAQTPLRAVVKLAYRPMPDAAGSTAVFPTSTDLDEDALSSIPAVPIPQMPAIAQLWRRAVVVAWVALAVLFFDWLTLLLSDYWLLQSMGFSDVFWTNFRMGATLFVSGALLFATAVAVPAFVHPLPARTRRLALGVAGLVGLLAGAWLTTYYHEFLLLQGQPFGETDPIFGRDVGFYVFTLPAFWVMWRAAMWSFAIALVSSVMCAYAARRQITRNAAGSRVAVWLGTVATAPTLVAFAGLGISTAFGVWLGRYNLLLKDSYSASVFTGASYIDVTGLFSTLNQIWVTAVILLGLTAAFVVLLWALRQQTSGRGNGRWPKRVRWAGTAVLLLILADFAFAGLVSVRDALLVTPNQPVIQLPYIERHLEATRLAYGLDQIEEIEFVPRNNSDPMPSLEYILNSSTMRNAPLWPTYVSYLEQIVDPQHSQRILQTGGDNMIYGPSLEIFRQQEKLRTYYNFLDVDVLRYTINGEKVVLASAVRELPILEPQPWLAWWGQRFMLFTHGHGLAMAPVGQTTTDGDPDFVSSQIPVQADWPEITAVNQAVYYGEGNASMAVSNVRDMAELDYPTDQGRAEIVLPADVPAGVEVDSLLKRLVFGWRSGEFWEMVFSTLITPETRVHYFRQPLQRLDRVAPFLFLEANPYATIVEGEITWLVNAMTTTDMYPYSQHESIGDKSLSRAPETVQTRRLNYVEDSVKATINAATGQVQLYKIADDPVINSWAAIYPSLFTDGEQMPPEVRQQLTYPLQLFHLLFDDLYIYYHMNDPMYFFNMEDMWDDADEVLGPVMDRGKAITFSVEPYHMLVETGGLLPEAAEKQQFVMTMPFTPEGARNLRAMPMVYQDGEDYGRLFVLMVPKGLFITGPEQADAIIDQDPDISEKISWWNRMGTEVIRGHTSLLLIDEEVVYVEPIFIRSEQNSNTQLKRVVVVMRGQSYMSETLEQAMRLAYDSTASGIVASGQ
ncbi:MAG: UPF0182 family protein [Chloroflexi bacterium]|nr:UPF0182 family protein [Chloroflexota bacterium]